VLGHQLELRGARPRLHHLDEEGVRRLSTSVPSTSAHPVARCGGERLEVVVDGLHLTRQQLDVLDAECRPHEGPELIVRDVSMTELRESSHRRPSPREDQKVK
jgi:hypothetical protein